MDEQNIEGVHPQFNQLVRRFGNTRGRRRQQLVMNEFLFSHSTWAVQTVDDMLRKTKRNVVRGNAKESEVNSLAPSSLLNDTINAGQPGRRDNDEEAEDDDEEADDGLFPATATLTEMERRINSNTAFHDFKNVDTKISACQVCKRRLLQFAAPVHCHEVHKTHAGEETNE